MDVVVFYSCSVSEDHVFKITNQGLDIYAHILGVFYFVIHMEFIIKFKFRTNNKGKVSYCMCMCFGFCNEARVLIYVALKNENLLFINYHIQNKH